MKLLTIKAATLISITALTRADELGHLLKDNYAETDNGLSFRLSKAPKNHRHGPIPEIAIDKVPDRPNSCPVTCITEYMLKTQRFREIGDDQIRSNLFLSLDARHCNVKVGTISRWIQVGMGLAGIDTTSFKPHSIRGAAVSSMAQKGFSFKYIMKKGRWRTNSVLSRFYLRDLPRFFPQHAFYIDIKYLDISRS